MTMTAVLLMLAVFFTHLASADNWAVLIAGSNYFFNYRHQSDICHAYQILTKKGGIPASNIVVMMYDDIAHNRQNPFPGKIFNKPNGTNVYSGVKIDYRGAAVNKTTFLKVLRGDTSAGGKVLKSTAQDDVFIYYSDHGATGLVAMPTGDVLYADELMDALRFMHDNHMYRQLVFYLEACESGSMFAGLLPSNMSIYATTAANSDESSYAYYFWQPVGTYLGDEYSIRWMEDSDANWKSGESLKTQFAHVKKLVKQSHPQKFGTMAWTSEPISDFQGDNQPPKRSRNHVVLMRESLENDVGVSSRDVKLFYLMQKYAAASNPQTKSFYAKQMNVELEYRRSVEMSILSLVENVLRRSNVVVSPQVFMSKYLAPRRFDCLRVVMRSFADTCQPLEEYGLKFVKNLVQLCETFRMDVIVDGIAQVCPVTMSKQANILRRL